MSELINGKEALIALANGEEVEVKIRPTGKWVSICELEEYKVRDIILNPHGDEFRIKPRTITINGVEVPAPFNPKEGEECCYLSDESVDGFHTISYNPERYAGMVFGLYRPSDVEQVVAELRRIFK